VHIDPLAEQQKVHEQGIFGAVRDGNLDAVLRFCEEDPKCLNERDPVGAAPIHAAVLYQKQEIAKALIEDDRFRHCAVYQYTAGKDGLYVGENILHIAIIQQNIQLVQWLLEKAPGLLKGEAVGTFLSPGKDTYFGGYPLLFAVASNQMDMVEAILNLELPKMERKLEPYQNILLTDKHGNSALHLAVVHDLKDMYDFCCEEAEECEKELDPNEFVPLRFKRNVEGLSPLALAAAMGNKDMFEHILKKNTLKAWTYGPVVCYMVPLLGLEQPTVDDDGNVQDSLIALECLCGGYKRLTGCLPERPQGPSDKCDERVYEARLEMIMLPAIKGLLDKKWDYFGKPIFKRKRRFFFVVQILWTISVVIPNHYRSKPTNLSEFPISNGFIIAAEAIVGIMVLLKLVGEVVEIAKRGVKAYFTQMRGSSALDNVTSLSFNLLYLVGFIFRRLGPLNPAYYQVDDVCHGFAALVGWMTMFFFLLGLRQFGPFIIMIKEMLINDMRRFAAVYVSVLMGYTMSLYLTLDNFKEPGLAKFFEHMKELMLLGTVGELPGSMDDWDRNRWMAEILLFTYIVFVVVLLLNLLIAMMGNTYTKVDEAATRRWYAELAGMMMAFERELDHEEMQQQRSLYSIHMQNKAKKNASSTGVSSSLKEFYFEISVHDPSWKLKTCEGQELDGITQDFLNKLELHSTSVEEVLEYSDVDLAELLTVDFKYNVLQRNKLKAWLQKQNAISLKRRQSKLSNGLRLRTKRRPTLSAGKASKDIDAEILELLAYESRHRQRTEEAQEGTQTYIYDTLAMLNDTVAMKGGGRNGAAQV